MAKILVRTSGTVRQEPAAMPMLIAVLFLFKSWKYWLHNPCSTPRTCRVLHNTWLAFDTGKLSCSTGNTFLDSAWMQKNCSITLCETAMPVILLPSIQGCELANLGTNLRWWHPFHDCRIMFDGVM